MDTHEKVEYYTRIVLNDLENDEYEDIVLTQLKTIVSKSFIRN